MIKSGYDELNESVMNEAQKYGNIKMSSDMKKLMKEVFQQSAKDPENFIHILGNTLFNEVYTDDGEVKNDKLDQEFTDLFDKIKNGLKGIDNGYF